MNDMINTAILTEAMVEEYLSKPKGETNALHLAAEWGDLEKVKTLIDSGIDVNAIDEDSRTPLILGVLGEHIDIVDVLIAAGADVNTWNGGCSALNCYASSRIFKIAKALIAAGAYVDSVDCDLERTPLHYSAKEGCIDVSKALIDAGATLDAMDMYGMTPLHVSASRGHVEIVKELISAGANSAVKDYDGFAIFDESKNNKTECAIIRYTVLYQPTSKLKTDLKKRDAASYRMWLECEDQVKRMKETFFRESCTSFFTFITETDQNKLAFYSSTEKFGICNKVARVSYSAKFPWYGEDIEAQFHRGMERANLLHQSQEPLISCFCYTLPPEIVTKICGYMTNHDLKKFLGTRYILEKKGGVTNVKSHQHLRNSNVNLIFHFT